MTKSFPIRAVVLAAIAAGIVTDLQAGPLRDRLRERLQERAVESADPESQGGNALSCADWSRRVDRLQARTSAAKPGPQPDLKDVGYGSGQREKLDVYLPAKGGDGLAPVIVMVHGGGWCVGDKAVAGVTENKVARWADSGFVFVSVNCPMVNDGSNALAQANHVARAIAYVQAHARDWHGDPTKVILMGHSAGAHLVSLVNADRRIRQANGVAPLLGTVSLDAGAIDVVRQMPNIYPFLKARYREAFGDDEPGWIAASPYHQIDRSAGPWLGVCSTTRKDDPCAQARAYAEKSNSLGVKAGVEEQAMSHGALNKELGLATDYTRRVEAFMAGLDPAVERRLR